MRLNVVLKNEEKFQFESDRVEHESDSQLLPAENTKMDYNKVTATKATKMEFTFYVR